MTVQSVQSTGQEETFEPVTNPTPTQESYIAAGLGVSAFVVFILSSCCVPLAVLSLLLGAGAAYLGWQVHQSVSNKQLHPVNDNYALVGLFAGGFAGVWSLFNLIIMVVMFVAYVLILIVALLAPVVSSAIGA